MNTQVPFIALRTESGFKQKVEARWSEALDKSAFIAGKAVTELGHKILDFTGAKFFIGCANGTDAIQIALRAVGIGPGDKVLLPDFTFWATYEAIINVGAMPVMVDISFSDFQMDFELCLKAISQYKPKAIILVHLYGWASGRLSEFRAHCKKNNIYLLEDGAQAMGSFYEGEPIFKDAFLATTSFYPAKVLGAAGDAGGIFTNNNQVAEVCHKLANHGRSSHYGHQYIGWNSRMDELQAHYLCESLEHLQKRIDSRRKAETQYLQFATSHHNLPLTMHKEPDNVKGNGYLQVSLAKTNYSNLSVKLKEKGIDSGNVYPSPMSAQEGAKNPILVTEHKITYEISRKVLNLPLFPYITNGELNFVCETLKNL
jgi:UDP-2-acetamido-2-deoxy-ribo-hexuluronate aminotransferase